MNLRMSLRQNQTLFKRDSVEERITIEPSRLRELDVGALGVRFAFGFTVSVIVGAIGLAAGDRVAGLFLAFPAILPASLTLIAEEDGEDKAKVDAAGACFGGVGLSAYGAASWFLLSRVAPVAAELGALVAWAVVAIGGYLVVRSRLRA
jgi:uncharacterized membrane protein (GlpM family)